MEGQKHRRRKGHGKKHRHRTAKPSSQGGAREHSLDLSFLKQYMPADQFYSQDDVAKEEFGFQQVKEEDPLEYRQIFDIMHGLQGKAEIPDNKDDYAGLRGEIAYYCKDCETFVLPVMHKKRKYMFTCGTCKSEHVSWGTEQSLRSHFHIRESVAPPVKEEQESASEA